MPELRWTLLIVGALFIAALAWWELRRKRQGGRRSSGPVGPAEHGQPARRAFDDPPLILPEIRVREEEDESLLGLRVDGERIEETLDAEPAAPEPIVPPPPPGPAPASLPQAPVIREPVVEWPPEDVRQIVALRLVATRGERMPGRSLRQALAAEGFVLGRFSIFHKAGPDDRAVVSAASLTRPGTFDVQTMDTQRFAGLSLFAVLPGLLPGPQAFDELLSAARNLRERLGGTIQDENGAPLTAERVEQLRESLTARESPEVRESVAAPVEEPSEPRS